MLTAVLVISHILLVCKMYNLTFVCETKSTNLRMWYVVCIPHTDNTVQNPINYHDLGLSKHALSKRVEHCFVFMTNLLLRCSPFQRVTLCVHFNFIVKLLLYE